MFNLLKKQQKQTKNKEKSRGRSMVEMLGVLAIIGVLSIGGIQGYTIAMRKYRTNEVVEYLSKFTTIVYTRFQSYAQSHNIKLSDHLMYDQFRYYVDFYGNGELDYDNCYDPYCGLPEKSADVDLVPPVGVSVQNISMQAVLPENSNSRYGYVPPSDYIQLTLYVEDTELCKSVANTLSIWPSWSSLEREMKSCENKDKRYRYFAKYIPVNS